MLPGLVLISIGAVIALYWFHPHSGAADFHLFAALNLIGLGAICCTVAYHLSRIFDLMHQRSAKESGLPGIGADHSGGRLKQTP